MAARYQTGVNMRFYEFNEDAVPPEGDTFAIKMFKAMQAAQDAADAQRAARLNPAGAGDGNPGAGDGNPGAGGNTTPYTYTPSKGTVNPAEIKSYLASKGFDNNQIAGWLVNIKWESGFRPGAYIASDAGQGQSGGFFGFHDKVNGKGLFTQMVAFTGGGNKWQTNWQGQLDFALQDSRGQQYKNMNFRTPGDAAHWWVVHYEQPRDTQSQASARAKDASRYA